MKDYELLNEWMIAWISGEQAIERGVHSEERPPSEKLWGWGLLYNDEPEIGGGSVWVH